MGRTTNLRTSLVMAVFLMAMGCTAAGGTIYVDADASGANNGSSWTDAYRYLQNGLAAAMADDEIWVAEGTYKPDANSADPNGSGDRTATFRLKNGVAICGGFGGGESSLEERNPNTYETILSGDLNGDDVGFTNNGENSYHVVTGSGTNATAVLDGFTITCGNDNQYGGPPPYDFPIGRGGGMYNENGSPTVANCTFAGNSASYSGGGMLNYDNSSPTVTNCTFRGNSAFRGGGMFNSDSSSMVTNCTFSGNSASRGGGMGNWDYSSPTLVNCIFTGNSADWYGGGMRNYYYSDPTLTNCIFTGNTASYHGGGMCNKDSSPTVTNCTFSGNSTTYLGGGMFNYSYSSPMLTNCTFSGNSATYGGGMCNGGRSDPTVTNCTFSGNSANSVGGGMCNYNDHVVSGCSPLLRNCTFAGNSASYGKAVACDSDPQQYPSSVQVTNCILWDGGTEICNNDGSTITITYSDVQGGWPGTGNIDEDPLFIDPNGPDGIPGTADDEEGYVHLRGYSPCINAGDPAGDYSGQVDVDNQPRVAYGWVDIGADEVFPILGDSEPDGDVDFADFARFANNWLLGAE